MIESIAHAPLEKVLAMRDKIVITSKLHDAMIILLVGRSVDVRISLMVFVRSSSVGLNQVVHGSDAGE
jgi:hypothetical protein